MGNEIGYQKLRRLIANFFYSLASFWNFKSYLFLHQMLKIKWLTESKIIN